MTIREERLLHRLWRRYRNGKPVANQTLHDFFFDVVRYEQSLSRCNAFEVFDSLTNPIVLPKPSA
ncbi:MAG: hypothetical protein AAGI15_06945 [Pseudomonadota bacterium]